MKKFKNILEKTFNLIELAAGPFTLLCGLGIVLYYSFKINFKYVTVIRSMIGEIQRTNNLTGNNVNNLVFIGLILLGFVLIGVSIPHFADVVRLIIRDKKGFDEINVVKQGDTEITYGIIHGNNTIVFIKAGMHGSYYGYENKYLKIAKLLNKKHGCTVITASNPNGYLDDFESEMKSLKAYAYYHKWDNYQIYYMGHSNGASLGMINAYKFPEIKKLVCINGPLIIEPQKLIPGLEGFSGEKMYLVYGSKDPSYEMLKLYSQLESDKIEFVRIHGANHNFGGCLELFIDLPGLLFFGDEIKCKNIKRLS